MDPEEWNEQIRLEPIRFAMNSRYPPSLIQLPLGESPLLWLKSGLSTLVGLKTGLIGQLLL